jgi:hypothetical protein
MRQLGRVALKPSGNMRSINLTAGSPARRVAPLSTWKKEAAMSSATPKLVTLEGYANERQIRVGAMLYLRSQPGFPRPVLKHGREAYSDRGDIVRFLKETRPHHWIAKC